MGKTICIVSQSHISRNPRVVKEAIALAQAGYNVHILTAIYSSELLAEDLSLLHNTGITYSFYSDLRKINLASFTDKLIKKLFVLLQKHLNIHSSCSLGYGAFRLKKQCLAYNADLYIMHQELAMIIGSRLISKYKIAFDLEDWHSEDLLPCAQKKRPIVLLKKSEKIAIEKSIYCTTTSKVMASGLQKAYHTTRKPAVIYNSFNTVSNFINNKNVANHFRLYWFSQTIGSGRGLEFFIDSMAKSNVSWHLTIRGNIEDDYKLSLIERNASKDQLLFLPLLKNEEILHDLSNYDIGLALEPNNPLNKNLTISNKFFHYMAGGLPIIASDTLGHKEIADQHPEIIFLYKNGDYNSLVNLLNDINTRKKGNLLLMQTQVNSIYNKFYNWENESKKLLQLVQDALK